MKLDQTQVCSLVSPTIIEIIRLTFGKEPFTLASDNYLELCESNDFLPSFDVRREHSPSSSYDPIDDKKSFIWEEFPVKVEVLSC